MAPVGTEVDSSESGPHVASELARLGPGRDEIEAGRVYASLHERMFGPTERVTIGRFEVIDRLGAGAMGVVYAARDPRLDRDVALKVLRGEHRTGVAAARLLREAKALARLRHPHVVAIFEIGTHDDGLFIAMDRIDGQTLRDWLRDEPPWQRILDVFVQAGRGLAAAHDAELVHRDFKPDNVLVDTLGQAKVVDFGLAREGGFSAVATQETRLEDTEPGTPELTRTGALVGTPAYMAPEAFRGHSDARSDQFSYCASLYEALHGVRPFRGQDVAELIESIERGRFERPIRGRSAPLWLKRIVLRGLAAEPEDRFESMHALLEAIEKHRRRRSNAMLGATGVGGLLLGGLGVSASLGGGGDRCTQAASGITEVWDDARRDALQQAFRSTGAGHADQTWTRVEATVEDYATRWATMRVESCTATQRGEQSDSLHDLRMACLDRKLVALHALLELFSAADETLVTRAVEAARALPELEPCADERALRASDQRGPAPELRERAAELEEALIALRMRMHAGHYGAALVEAEAITREAGDLGLSDVAAVAHLLVAQLHDELEDLDSAALAAKNAVWAAEEAGNDLVRAEATTWLVSIVGKRHDLVSGHEWARTGQALVTRLGAPVRLQAMLADHEATLMHHAGQLEDSVRRRRDALQLRMQFLPSDDLTVAATHHNLAKTLGDLDRLDEALTSLERVLEIRIEALGEQHPAVARAHNAIASMLTDQGRFDEATEHLHEAIEIGSSSLGSDHPFVADVLVHLGNVVAQGSDPVSAIPHYRRAVAIFEAAEVDDVRIARALGNYGRVLWGTGRLEEALVILERSLALQERVLGPEHVSLIYVLNTLSQTHTDLGDHEQARQWARRGLAVASANLGDDHAMVAQLLLGLGQSYLATNEPQLALQPLERALGIHERASIRRAERGPVAFSLAQALWDTGARPRAIELARSAREDFETEPHHDVWLREIAQWLQERTADR